MGIGWGITYILLSTNTIYMEKKDKNNNKEIIKTWLTGKHSCTLVIPREFAKEYGLDEPTHVIVEGTSQGILIRKLSF